MEQVDESLRLLARSDTRADMLLALHADDPLDRYDLEERLDASRRTVTRAANTLTEEGYVRETDAGYALTAFGRMMAAAYREYRETVELLERFRPFLRDVESEALDFDPEWLRGADLTVGSEEHPYVLLDRILELRREATDIREMAPGVEKRSVEQLAERLRDGEDLSVEVVLPAGALEAAASHPQYAEDHRVARESDAVDYYRYPEQFPLFVGVLDDTVLLASGTETGPTALVESDRPELREWAEERIDWYRREATPLDGD